MQTLAMLPFTAPPELTTGLSDLFVIISALACHLSFRALRQDPWWQALFALLALAGLFGVVVHCFAFSATLNSALWLVLDFLLSATVALLLLTALHEAKLLSRYLVTGTLLLALISAVCMHCVSYEGQFVVIAAFGALCVLAAIISYWRLSRTTPAYRLSLLGLAVLLAGMIPWVFGDILFSFCGLLCNQNIHNHLAAALSLPLLAAGATEARKRRTS